MTVNEYLEKLDKLEERTITLRLQMEMLNALKAKYEMEKFEIGKEYLCTYDVGEFWNEYSVKLRKCLYFLEKYYSGMRSEILAHTELLNRNEVFACPGYSMEEAIYNFDAFILAACAVIDNEEKNYLAVYLKKTDIRPFYPDRREIGLFWQLNLLRNRIIHHTGGRYENKEVCQRYFDFSSHVRMMKVVDGHFYLECTQIDIHTSETVRRTIMRAIENNDRINIFNELFPERKAKGKNKKAPVMIIPNERIYFDHVYGGQWVAGAVQDFLYKIIQAIFKELCGVIKEKSMIPEMKICFIENGEQYQMAVKDLFACEGLF